MTTGADYDHRQNSKIERHFRRLGDDARPGFLQSKLDDKFYQCALVDASAKHKLLPLARVPGQSPTTMMTGKPGKALHRPSGCLATAAPAVWLAWLRHARARAQRLHHAPQQGARARGAGDTAVLRRDGSAARSTRAANVITLVRNFISSKMTRHITRRECIVREREADGTIAVTKVPTADNLADLFTRSLARDPFTKLRSFVLNILVKGILAPIPRARRAASKGI